MQRDTKSPLPERHLAVTSTKVSSDNATNALITGFLCLSRFFTIPLGKTKGLGHTNIQLCKNIITTIIDQLHSYHTSLPLRSIVVKVVNVDNVVNYGVIPNSPLAKHEMRKYDESNS